MSTSPVQIYFIAGATRGIGLALVADVASKYPAAIIYAGARDPTASGASELKELASRYPHRIEVVKYVAGDKEENDAVAKLIGEKHGHVDTVIANAAIGNSSGKIHEVSVSKFQDHFSVNVIGPIVLFQSFHDLLKASPLPRFISITSGLGSIELIPTVLFDSGAYGVSKAALNWATRKIHFENDWLVSFPLCPGAVETDMTRRTIEHDTTGNVAAIKHIWRSPIVAANILVDIIAASTREENGGQFNNIEGERYPW